jgi:hypothetical protein
MTTYNPNPPAAHRVSSPSTRWIPNREVITNTAAVAVAALSLGRTPCAAR